MRALMVEDDVDAARGFDLLLRAAQVDVDHVETGEEACEYARQIEYDVILLDLCLPDMDGYDVVRRLRRAQVATPVLVLSGTSSAEARVKALELGADDFLVKPFDRSELLARMRAVIRRNQGFSGNNLTVGNVTLNLQTHDVSLEGRAINLTGKEFQVLELLVLRKGFPLSKEAFLTHLYGGRDEPEAKTIDVFIYKVRKKFASAGAPDVIDTIRGRGYIVRDHCSPKDPSPNNRVGRTQSGRRQERHERILESA